MAAEVEALQAAGFGRHLTRRELVVFEADGSVQENELRWANEPVRHKVLDCIGDLALSGFSSSGRIVACRSGHKLNHVMARVLSTIVSTEAGQTVMPVGRAA
jgi:UDP-3-O-acyl-N-acetylglucosamine deacetylase